MAFIKVQNLKRDGKGTVVGGTASIIDVEYVAGGRQHSRQKPREPLGKVIWIAENRRNGIFLSRTRGLVAYDADADGDGNGPADGKPDESDELPDFRQYYI